MVVVFGARGRGVGKLVMVKYHSRGPDFKVTVMVFGARGRGVGKLVMVKYHSRGPALR